MRITPYIRVLTFSLVLIALSQAASLTPAAGAGEPSSDQVLQSTVSDLVVRVSFDDERLGQRLAISIEPLEAHFDQGYLILIVSPEEYLRLLDTPGLQVEVDEARTAKLAEIRPLNEPGLATIPGYPCYRTVEETYATAQAIADSHPELATWTDVGDSWEKSASLGGYDMRVLRLTNRDLAGPKPKAFITAAIHAREYTTAELITRLAEKLVEGYGVDPDATWLLDEHEIHLMLQTNPDGRKHAEAGALWRKNTNQNYCFAFSNYRGADLNRNFPFRWGCCGGSSGNPCSETYRGPSPASEPETQAVRDYMLAQFPDQRGPDPGDPAPLDASGIYIDVHSSGRLLLWPWGFTSQVPPNGAQLQTLGRKLAYFNGHSPEQAIGLYPTDGTTDDFAYGELGLAAFTYELGTNFFESCGYFENTLIPDNLPSLLYALKVARTPYLTPAGPDSYNLQLNAGGSPPGVDPGVVVTLRGTADDTRYNNSNGTEPTQVVTAAEVYIDVPPWSERQTPVPIAMSPVDGSYDAKVEDVSVDLDTAGLGGGRHILFVRARDFDGNWGAVSAAFLYVNAAGPTPTASWTPTVTDTLPAPSITPTPTPMQGVLFADDFEVDRGWVPDPFGTDTATTGLWERGIPEGTSYNGVPLQLGASQSGSYDLVTGAAAGSGVGANDIDDGSTSIRSPEIVLPGSGEITLSFAYSFGHLSNASAEDYLRLRVVGDTTETVFEVLGAAVDRGAGWGTVVVDLSGFAGQRVYLLVEAADAGGSSLVEAAIDDVIVRGGGATQPTPTASWTPTVTDTLPAPSITPTPTPMQGVLFADDFEVDRGWVPDPFGTDTATTGLWERGIPEGTSYNGVPLQLGASQSGSYDLVTGAAAGSGVGANDIDDGSTSIRSPEIVLPGSGEITLSFAYSFGHLSNASAEDYLRLRVVGDTTETVFEVLGAAVDRGAGWGTVVVDLSGFAGQRVYLLVEAADAGGSSLVEAAIDDVIVRGGGATQPTPTASWTPTVTDTLPAPSITPTPTPTQGVLFADDFEVDRGWVPDPFGTDTATTGLWERGIPEGTSYNGVPLQLGASQSGSYDLVTGAAAGSGVGANDIDDGSTSIRSPEIVLPGSGEITLSFAYSFGHLSNASAEDYLRLRVVGDTTETVFEVLGAAVDRGAGWGTVVVDLSDFAGQRVYLLVEAADAGGSSLVEAAIDDVIVRGGVP